MGPRKLALWRGSAQSCSILVRRAKGEEIDTGVEGIDFVEGECGLRLSKVDRTEYAVDKLRLRHSPRCVGLRPRGSMLRRVLSEAHEKPAAVWASNPCWPRRTGCNLTTGGLVGTIFVQNVSEKQTGGDMDETELKIREVLDEFWEERAIPAGPDGDTIVDELVAPVESLTAVDVLAELDAIVGCKLPSSVIRAGGYSTKDEFIEKLTASVLKHVRSKK
jgi:hypothetical protein